MSDLKETLLQKAESASCRWLEYARSIIGDHRLEDLKLDDPTLAISQSCFEEMMWGDGPTYLEKLRESHKSASFIRKRNRARAQLRDDMVFCYSSVRRIVQAIENEEKEIGWLAYQLGYVIGLQDRVIKEGFARIREADMDQRTSAKKKRVRTDNEIFWNQVKAAWNDYLDEGEKPVKPAEFLKWLAQIGEEDYDIRKDGNTFMYAGISVKRATIQKKLKSL